MQPPELTLEVEQSRRTARRIKHFLGNGVRVSHGSIMLLPGGRVTTPGIIVHSSLGFFVGIACFVHAVTNGPGGLFIGQSGWRLLRFCGGMLLWVVEVVR